MFRWVFGCQKKKWKKKKKKRNPPSSFFFQPPRSLAETSFRKDVDDPPTQVWMGGRHTHTHRKSFSVCCCASLESPRQSHKTNFFFKCSAAAVAAGAAENTRPNHHQRWHVKWKLSWNIYTFLHVWHPFVCSVGAYEQNFCVGARSEVY